MKNIRDALKRRLFDNLPGEDSHLKLTPSFRLDSQPNASTTDASVLILIYPNYYGIYNIVLMKRQKYDGPHSAQISFPGGKYENIDKNLEITALRECNEEIGINTKTVEILGKLTHLYIPVSNFLVHPFIGYTDQTPIFNIDKNEVDYLIEFPIDKIPSLTIKHTVLSYEQDKYPVPYFDINHEIVWGATSMILSEFIDLIKDIRP